MLLSRMPDRRVGLVARLVAVLIALGLLAAPATPGSAHAVEGGRFVTTWTGSIARLCLYGDVDVAIDWGDGTSQTVTGTRGVYSGLGPVTHTFAQSAPTHQVVVTGTFDVLGCAHRFADLSGLVSVEEWGATGTTDLTFGLAHTTNLQSVVEPPVTVTKMGLMFHGSGFDGAIGHWDTSRVTDMHGMFYRSEFNQPIGGWDTSNVTWTSYMFAESPFNQPIGGWDTGNVTAMDQMFLGTTFDRPIGSWDTSKVTTTWGMFMDSTFNQPIGRWDTRNVSDFGTMFAGSTFNRPIGGWDVRSASSMEGMFQYARAFNQDLSTWCVPGLTEEPPEFARDTVAWTLPHPPWGSCGRTDSLPPDAAITSIKVTDQALIRGTASDDTGVARVLCAIQDRATGEWLRRDRTWGAYDRLNAILTSPGATRTTWRLGRRLPPGSYTVKVIDFDIAGKVNPPPRPTRIVRVP